MWTHMLDLDPYYIHIPLALYAKNSNTMRPSNLNKQRNLPGLIASYHPTTSFPAV